MDKYETSSYLIEENRIHYDPDEAIELLESCVTEMEDRYKKFSNVKPCKDLKTYNSKVGNNVKLPWRVVVLDEYADLTSQKEDRLEIEKNLKRISQKGERLGSI